MTISPLVCFCSSLFFITIIFSGFLLVLHHPLLEPHLHEDLRHVSVDFFRFLLQPSEFFKNLWNRPIDFLLARIDIAGGRQVVVIPSRLFVCYDFDETLNVMPLDEGLSDLSDIFIRDIVLWSALLKLLACVHQNNIALTMGEFAAIQQNDDACGSGVVE